MQGVRKFLNTRAPAHTNTYARAYTYECTGRIASQAIQMIGSSGQTRARFPRNDDFVTRQTRGKGAGAVGVGGRGQHHGVVGRVSQHGSQEVRHTIPTTERPGLWWRGDHSTTFNETQGSVHVVNDGVSLSACVGAGVRMAM
jgi:hypothetical protein